MSLIPPPVRSALVAIRQTLYSLGIKEPWKVRVQAARACTAARSRGSGHFAHLASSAEQGPLKRGAVSARACSIRAPGPTQTTCTTCQQGATTVRCLQGELAGLALPSQPEVSATLPAHLMRGKLCLQVSSSQSHHAARPTQACL